jgi:vacuolar-type H+-ATPase subunit C/Vma6
VRVLLAHGYEDASRLLVRPGHGPADLLPAEGALLGNFARRARRAVAAGDRILQEFVREVIDVGNVTNALLIAADPKDVDPAEVMVEGGRWLTRDAFIAAASAEGHDAAVATLVTALAPSPLAGIVTVRAQIAAVELSWFETSLRRLQRAARLDPLSTAPVLRVLLLVDAEARDVRTLAWGTALDAPPALRVRHLVTPR